MYKNGEEKGCEWDEDEEIKGEKDSERRERE